MRNFLLLICILSAGYSGAQITGSTLVGRILDDQREPLPGATVILFHLPTGTQYGAVADEKGRFVFPEMRAGEGYQLEAALLGFSNFTKNDIRLPLGETVTEEIEMTEQATELEEIVVRHNKNLDKKGAATSVVRSSLEQLPTLSNSLQDFTRLSPFAANNSFAGANYRYNNLAIDGAVNNDAFGFVEPSAGAAGSQASGTPGSLARAQPISLEAIKELQVAITPFDVVSGNFTGGSINTVTRSGTNDTQGAVYSFLKNPGTTGRSADRSRTKINQFGDYLAGFTLGGPLVKNRLFYFANVEYNYRTEPAKFPAGSPESAFAPEDLQRIADTLFHRYQYDAGATGDASLLTQNTKVFARLDWQAGHRDQFSLRHNWVDAQADHLSRTATIFNFGSQGFAHFSTAHSTVLEWKRRISEKWFNKAIVSHAWIDEHRKPFGAEFPHVEITYGTAGTIFLGQYRESSIFRTRQRTVELTDNLQFFSGNHHLTIGTHNEAYRINYHFVTPWTGRWAFRSIDDFLAEKPSRIRRTFNLSDNSYDYNFNRPSADFDVLLTTFYIQDEVSIFQRRLVLSAGLRLDGSIFPTRPQVHPDALETPEFSGFQQQISNKWALAPRFGFNYKLDDRGGWLLRGGSGLFVGRMPFAWMAYSFLYDGNHFANIDYRPPSGEVVPLQSSVEELTARQGNFQREINLLDPNLHLPQVWRNSLAIEKRWKNGWLVILEGVFTQTLFDTKFETGNLKNASTPLAPWDNRPRFSGEKVNPDFTSVFIVTNTRQGYRYQASVSVQKTAAHWNGFLNYTYGQSKDLANGVRVSPQANWEWNQTLAPNDPRLSLSNFDIRHRVVSSVAWSGKWQKQWPFSLALVYTASSGVPFSYVYTGDVNRDGSPTNDLIYVPASLAESGLTDIQNAAGEVTRSAAEQWENLQTYINNDPYLRSRKGDYAERNGGRSPWNQQLDLRFLQQFEFKNGQKIQLTLDFINLSNLIAHNWGRQYFVSNTTNAGYPLLTFLRWENNAPQFRFDAPTTSPWQYDPIFSRMQGQVGLKFIF